MKKNANKVLPRSEVYHYDTTQKEKKANAVLWEMHFVFALLVRALLSLKQKEMRVHNRRQT